MTRTAIWAQDAVIAIALYGNGCSKNESHTEAATTPAPTTGAEQPGNEMGAGAPGQMSPQAAEACPMLAQGARVQYQPIEGGAALVFTSDESSLQDLRDRVRKMASMHNEMHQPASGMNQPSG